MNKGHFNNAQRVATFNQPGHRQSVNFTNPVQQEALIAPELGKVVSLAFDDLDDAASACRPNRAIGSFPKLLLQVKLQAMPARIFTQPAFGIG